MTRRETFEAAPSDPERDRIPVLHLLLKVTETSAPYNEHCLSCAPGTSVSLCTYFKSETTVHPSLPLFEGTGTPPGFYRALKRALAEKPKVLHVHAVHFAPLLLPLRTLRRLPPLVFTVHNSVPNLTYRNRGLMLVAKLMASRVVCCSQASLDGLPFWFPRLPGGRVTAVPNGVDTKRIDRVRAGAPTVPRADGFRIVSVGRLIPIKNPKTLLRAFERFDDPNSRLDFVGTGELGVEIVASAEASGIGHRVKTVGLVPRNEVYRVLDASDLFVSASYGEGLPVAALEALACGVPAILSDIPPHREIADGADVIPLVPPDDVDGFAREMKRFAAMPAAERRRIGEAGRSLVAKRFGLACMHDRYAEIYRSVAAERETRRASVGTESAR